jgi:hypothetical protein
VSGRKAKALRRLARSTGEPIGKVRVFAKSLTADQRAQLERHYGGKAAAYDKLVKRFGP